jgi:golgi-specific brefeldin A-resistance guanine nucleotide exchange factor 1
MAGEIGADGSLSSAGHPMNQTALIRSTPITVAVDPVALVVTECITVTSAMRKDARWRHSSVSAILGGGGVKAPPSQRRERGRALVGNAAMLDEEDAGTGRWGLRGKKGKSMQDHPLMAAFSRLRADLRGLKGVYLP